MGQLQEKYKNYRLPQKLQEKGLYPYFRCITGKQGTEVEMGDHHVLMFGSNAYTGLVGDQRIIDAAKAATDKYGTIKSIKISFSLKIHYNIYKYMHFFINLHSNSFNRAKDSFHHKPHIRNCK